MFVQSNDSSALAMYFLSHDLLMVLSCQGSYKVLQYVCFVCQSRADSSRFCTGSLSWRPYKARPSPVV